jgi:hypothetical protein
MGASGIMSFDQTGDHDAVSHEAGGVGDRVNRSEPSAVRDAHPVSGISVGRRDCEYSEGPSKITRNAMVLIKFSRRNLWKW